MKGNQMRVIKEEESLMLGGRVEVMNNKLQRLSSAKGIARNKCKEEPLLCEYKVRTSSGRLVKRYLVLNRKEIK